MRSARRVLLALGATLVLLLLCETGLRVLDLAEPRPRWFPGERAARDNPHFVADAALGWKMRPSIRFTWTTEGRDVQYEADAAGRRVVDPRAGDQPDGRRLVVVSGDSFAFGTGVTADETFAARLGVLLGGVAVVDVAEPGFGVDQIARAAALALDELRPAAIVVAIYPEDLERTRTAYRVKEGFAKPLFAVGEHGLVELGPDDRPAAPWLWLERHSRLFAAFDRIGVRHAIRSATGPRWDVSHEMLEDLADRCRARGAALLIVHVPTKDWDEFPALGSFARDHGIDYLDPLELAPAAPEGAYFREDSHLSAEGHRRLAEWIAPRLAAKLGK